MTLDEALQRLAAGEKDALEEIYRQTRKTVYYIALSVVRERMLAEDVMQTTYLKILAHAARYRVGSNARAWIARIAKNEAVTLWRRRRREISVDERAEAARFPVAEADEYGFLIDLARRVLKEAEFAVLLLAAAEGYKRREIAAMLGLPVATVSWHYGRAVDKMQRALSEQAHDAGGRSVDRRQMQEELRKEAEEHTPDVYGRILSAQSAPPQKGGAVALARPNRAKPVLACLLAAVLLFLAIFLPIRLLGGGGLSGTVYISINPAVEFVVEQDKVTGVKALNRDAALLVAGEDFAGLSPEDAGEKFVALSEEKQLITAAGVGVHGTGADGEALEQRVRARLSAGGQRYTVHELGQTELDALIAAYDERAMGEFEDYLERELSSLRTGFAERVHALMQTYLADLYAMTDRAAFNQKYLYLGEDCIFEDGDESLSELAENFRELERELARHGDAYIFDELFEEFLEAVEELYEPEDDEDDDDDDEDEDDDDDDDDD